MTRSSAGRLAKRRPERNAAACHQMVRDVAVGMAHETYAVLMQRNDWYRAWREALEERSGVSGMSPDLLEKNWVNLHWGDFIEGARAQLAAMLRQPLDDGLRDTIAEALILDNTLIRGRKAGQKLLGAL